MKIRANCKINIGLDVLRRRTDGYHDLDTAMFPVRELYDEVEVERCGQTDDVIFEQCGLTIDCPAESNLCVKSFRAVQARCGIGGVRIRLDKRVPFGAGLGSASSDAAAVVVALDRLFGLALTEQQLLDAAAATGSDTAFFIRNTPQLCRGRGEVLTPVSLPLAGKYLAILKPQSAVSTAEAYSGVRPAVPSVPLAELLARPLAQWQGSVKNDFEPHIFAAHPEIAALKERLLDAGALYASMSGSGSAVFGIFDSLPPHSSLCPSPDIFIHTERL